MLYKKPYFTRWQFDITNGGSGCWWIIWTSAGTSTHYINQRIKYEQRIVNMQ